MPSFSPPSDLSEFSESIAWLREFGEKEDINIIACRYPNPKSLHFEYYEKYITLTLGRNYFTQLDFQGRLVTNNKTFSSILSIAKAYGMSCSYFVCYDDEDDEGEYHEIKVKYRNRILGDYEYKTVIVRYGPLPSDSLDRVETAAAELSLNVFDK